MALYRGKSGQYWVSKDRNDLVTIVPEYDSQRAGCITVPKEDLADMGFELLYGYGLSERAMVQRLSQRLPLKGRPCEVWTEVAQIVLGSADCIHWSWNETLTQWEVRGAESSE